MPPLKHKAILSPMCLAHSLADSILYCAMDSFVRDKFLKKANDFIKELMLDGQLVRATDPFFAKKSSKLFMQKSADLKHEIQAWIPYEKKSIAVGSINLHLNTFGERFAMNVENCVASSACFGIGYERLTYSLFAQNGPLLNTWDGSVLDVLGL